MSVALDRPRARLVQVITEVDPVSLQLKRHRPRVVRPRTNTRNATEHPSSWAEPKKMKSLALLTNGCLKANLRDISFVLHCIVLYLSIYIALLVG